MKDKDLKKQMTRECQLAHAIKKMPGGLKKWIGRTVKKGFAQTAMPQIDKEWMWVEITHVEDNKLVGTLMNDPCLATFLEYGDSVTMTEEEIFAVHCRASEYVHNHQLGQMTVASIEK